MNIITEIKYNILPIIGEAAAGNPLTIYPDAVDSVNLPLLTNLPKDSFLLRVKGDSLKDAFIYNGDIVIINPNIDPSSNHIVAAIIDNEAVIKRLLIKQNVIELHSENPDYEKIVILKSHPNFRIAGVVIGIYRKMDVKII